MVDSKQLDVLPDPDVGLLDFIPDHHLRLLQRWLRRPHVARWWGDPDRPGEPPFPDPNLNQIVICMGEEPVGYMCWQKPTLQELEAAGLTDLPEDLMDIDILIGEPELTGRGIGPRALGLLLEKLRAIPGVAYAGAAASVSNQRSLRAFEKAGFHLFREFRDPDSGPCRYLIRDLRPDS